jgi:hypothetical protein
VAGQETTWVPAFPSQRPPFEPGNQLATTYHGAYSPRRVDPLAAELVAVVLDDPRYCCSASGVRGAAVYHAGCECR